MKKNFVNILSIVLSVVVFVFLIKSFYFDTNMGFETKILELNYSAFPMWVDVLITTIILPFIVYAVLYELFDRIAYKISYRKSN